MDSTERKFDALKGLWERRRRGLLMPTRNSFSTNDLKPWFGNLALIDIQEGLVRLCGTNLISRFGRDATGCNIDSLDEAVAVSIWSYINQARIAKSVSLGSYNSIIVGYSVSFRELVLPLSEDGVDVAMIMLCSYQAERKPAWH